MFNFYNQGGQEKVKRGDNGVVTCRCSITIASVVKKEEIKKDLEGERERQSTAERKLWSKVTIIIKLLIDP